MAATYPSRARSSSHPQSTEAGWPPLAIASWRDTCRTLHLFFQIVGKVKLALTPKTNQWWNVTFHLTADGLTTGPIPSGESTFEIDFDFLRHEVTVERSDGEERKLALAPRPVRDFHRELFEALGALGIEVAIWPVPVEIPMTTPFPEDADHRTYVAEAACCFWDALRRIAPVFEAFRARYRGKCSPVHFFWGSCDLAVTRFSGRRAPPRTGSIIERDAYDEEVCSVGFWPGNAWADSGGPDACFYAYAVPEPRAFSTAPVRPPAARYDATLKEFLLPYEAVRALPDPAQGILDFAESTYEAAATLASWDRERLAYP